VTIDPATLVAELTDNSRIFGEKAIDVPRSVKIRMSSWCPITAIRFRSTRPCSTLPGGRITSSSARATFHRIIAG
jgi:hypothetical protein